jgi:flagellar protein FlaJ
LGIPLLYRYSIYSKYRRIESTFTRFLRDITEGVNTGMTVTQAIRSAAKTDYGDFTPYAREMAAKITWGITLEKVLEDFANKIGSVNLKRTVQTINEAHKSGGTIHTVLEAVAETTHEIEKIKKERSASIYAQMINGYIIYFVFLGVMIGIASFLVPAFQVSENQGELQAVLPELFRNLVIIQGIFAGMAVGKMAEGTFIAGAKHSLALTAIGYSAFIFFA